MRVNEIVPSVKQRLGVGARRNHITWSAIGASAAFFGAGVALGAAIALLLAPRPGRELRGEIADRARRLTRGEGAEPEPYGEPVERPAQPATFR